MRQPDRSKSLLYYRHSLPVRIMHWINVLAFFMLLMSGLQIFNAHPVLNWGKSSYNGKPPLLELKAERRPDGTIAGTTRILDHRFGTTGVLGASAGPNGELTARGFPQWATIPGPQWLSMGRRWHFFFAWIFVLNGISYIFYSIFSRHLAGDLAPHATDWRSVGRSIKDHLMFRHPRGEAEKHYNVLQKLTYLLVIFVLLPLMVLTGMSMSPRLDTLIPGWVDLFGGRQSGRTIHFIVAWLLVGFVLIHVFEAAISGFWNNLRSMITGRYRTHPTEGGNVKNYKD